MSKSSYTVITINPEVILQDLLFLGMAKTFLCSIGVLILINLIIKTGLYFSYNKTTGTVIDIYESHVIKHGTNKTSHEITVVPTVAYEIEGYQYTISRKHWGFPGGYKVGEEVEVLYKDKELPELSGFFQYWLTLTHIFIIFILSVFLTVIIETILSNKKS